MAYEWARQKGWWLNDKSKKATHLCLDGGRLLVTDESTGLFLNAYASAILRASKPNLPDPRPCLVEVRTPVFVLHADLDAKMPIDDHETVAEEYMHLVCLAMHEALFEFFQFQDPEAIKTIICTTQIKRIDDRTVKHGRHVLFPGVKVTSDIALSFRQHVLNALEPIQCPFEGGWKTVIDAAVYTSSGLRMPYAAKKTDDPRTYVPTTMMMGPTPHVSILNSTSPEHIRAWVHELSIRCSSTSTTTPLNAAIVIRPATSELNVNVAARNIELYRDCLSGIMKMLPLEYWGSQFTGLVETHHCVYLRSSARYCFNLGRSHRSNNVYFVVTKEGKVAQRCYCRRLENHPHEAHFGLCKDYTSPWWGPVHPSIVETLFGTQAKEDAGFREATNSTSTDVASSTASFVDDETMNETTTKHVGGNAVAQALASNRHMPSEKKRTYLALENILERARPTARKTKKKNSKHH
jgi:hypothetical protein